MRYRPACGKSRDEQNDKNNEKNAEQYFRYSRGAGGDSTEPENRCYNRNYEKNKCPVAYAGPLLVLTKSRVQITIGLFCRDLTPLLRMLRAIQRPCWLSHIV
jgi:hypothetical protein